MSIELEDIGAMEREDLLALAQQGNTKAIAALLNQQLKYRQMHCQVAFIDQVLHVVVSAEGETPDRGTTLEFLRAKIINLDVKNLMRVRLYGLDPEAKIDAKMSPSIIPDHPCWTQEFALAVGDYSSLAAGLMAGEPDPANTAPIAAPSPSAPTAHQRHQRHQPHQTPKLHRSPRQPTTTSLAIVAITLGLIVFSGYKLIARNSRSIQTPADRTDPPTLIPTEP
jgi:hypothetical protein